MTIKICDVCGERMFDCGTSYNVTVNETVRGSATISRYTADICPSCNNKLKEKFKEMGVAINSAG